MNTVLVTRIKINVLDGPGENDPSWIIEYEGNLTHNEVMSLIRKYLRYWKSEYVGRSLGYEVVGRSYQWEYNVKKFPNLSAWEEYYRK